MSAPPSCEWTMQQSVHGFTPRSTPASLGASPLEFSRNVPSTSSSCGGSGGGRHHCAVCGDPADGIHFGAHSCAACGAFFRRSVSDQKVYACDGKRCLGNGRTTKKGGNCRYCRFQKCINAGMQPIEYFPWGKLDTDFGEPCAIEERLGVEETLLLYEKVNIEPIQIRNEPFQDHLDTTILAHLEEMSIEWRIFTQIITTNPLMKDFDSDSTIAQTADSAPRKLSQVHPNLRDLFLSGYLFELALSSVKNGGVQMDHTITTSGLKIELIEEELTRFFTTPQIRDPLCMARLCLPFFAHLVRVCARSLQSLSIDEIETAFLYYAVIASYQAPQSQLSGNTILSKLCSELTTHYDSTPEEIAQKMGNLLLTVSPFREALQFLHEYITLLEFESLFI
ncbi:unnamed protein product, partial [Mesorhabditis belari]|uniref:Nuclear receptor domain-containing protein n=1 Tax=Mesorhabditis belari TaxID=2138241 RepID=A0AAF3EWM0_9BILA